MSPSSNLLSGLTTVGIGTYIIAVVYNGNAKKLGSLLAQETGYIDFVIALFALGAIQKYGPTSKVANALTVITLIALMIKTSKGTNFASAITDFANGDATILETIKNVSGVD